MDTEVRLISRVISDYKDMAPFISLHKSTFVSIKVIIVCSKSMKAEVHTKVNCITQTFKSSQLYKI